MTLEAIEALYQDHQEMRDYFLTHEEFTFASDLEALSPKVLLLAAASYFETAVVQCVEDYVSAVSQPCQLVRNFVRNKALSRQYHTLFQWEAANVNKFWAFFGQDFKSYAEAVVQGDAELAEAASAFLEVGRLRNLLVHENYLAFTLEKTAAEVFEMAVRAGAFVERLPAILDEFVPAPGADQAG